MILLYLPQDRPLLLCRGLCPYCKSLFPNLVVYLVHAYHPFASRCPLLTGFIHAHQEFLSRIMKGVIVLLQLSFLAIFLDFPSLILLLCLAEGEKSVHLVPDWREKAWSKEASSNDRTSDNCSDFHGQSSGCVSLWPRRGTLARGSATTIAAPRFSQTHRLLGTGQGCWVCREGCLLCQSELKGRYFALPNYNLILQLLTH